MNNERGTYHIYVAKHLYLQKAALAAARDRGIKPSGYWEWNEIEDGINSGKYIAFSDTQKGVFVTSGVYDDDDLEYETIDLWLLAVGNIIDIDSKTESLADKVDRIAADVDLIKRHLLR